MAATMSKRNQARNEQALQELIRSVPGNDRCADCQARNPGWASWSLGIFLCMRCAALHRKLGTHISKVKSLSMDQWSNEQVENMKKIGNDKANETWNPKRVTAPIPLDVDEVDSAMERFIRQKYEQKSLAAGGGSLRKPTRSPSMPIPNRTSSPLSLDENPPPPPPKPGRKFNFGLRSSSSSSFLGKKEKEDKKKVMNVTPLAMNKESRVFGATIGVTESDRGLEMKLLQLREMGFSDTRRNTSALKGNGGDLERTIEYLMKAGETSSSADRLKTSARSTPVQQQSPAFSDQAHSNGATIVRSPVSQQHSSPVSTPRTNNPFEVQNRNVSATSAFDAAMAKMSLNSPPPPPPPQQQQQPQMSLFPNATGGHSMLSPPLQATSFQHSMTPPISQAPYINNPYTQQNSYTQQNPYTQNNPYAQSPTHNPFMAPQQPASPQHVTNPYMTQTVSSPNPFIQQGVQNQVFSPQYTTFSPQEASATPQHLQSPQQSQFDQSMMSSFGITQSVQSPMPGSGFMPQSPGGNFNPHQQQMQPLMSPGRMDKNSIMALYNYPQLAPALAVPPIQEEQAAPQLPLATPQRSVTMPMVGSKNPFNSTGSPGGTLQHHPQPSIDSTGRYSPDAFANLSARFGR